MDVDQILFSLNGPRFEQFMALLVAPAPPNAVLERLLAVRAPWAAAPMKPAS
jgi:uncharacterized protein (DUF1778 family)